MANGTKERILAAALEMFSQNGYAGTNIRELSALIHLCDREPEKTEDAMKQIEGFSRHFVRVYGEETYPDELDI